MTDPRHRPLTRRGFLASAALSSLVLAGRGRAAERPGPRATSGDHAEPDWAERLTVTVGNDKGDITGRDDRALQAAVDYVARLGGGMVQVLPGTFRLRNAIYLASRVRLKGSGPDSVLIKEPSRTSKLTADSDWYDQEVTLADPAGFRVGDGVCLRARNPHNGGVTVLKRTLVARSGARFKLDRPLRENLWLSGTPTAATLFPILSGENVSDIAIEDLALDGNRAANDNLDGNYAGCVFLQDCNRIVLRGVTARNYNGDGISWQVCHDVSVTKCHSHGHAGLGLHPGSGSQRPVMRDNRLNDNDIGLFFCWGVVGGLAENNTIEDSRSYGISIGHRDTDNLIRNNTVLRSGKVGVLFRAEATRAFSPHRNRVESNRVTDSGPDDGVAIDVQGTTEGVVLASNMLRETRGSAKRTGIRIAAGTRELTLRDNTLEGFAVKVADARPSAPPEPRR